MCQGCVSSILPIGQCVRPPPRIPSTVSRLLSSALSAKTTPCCHRGDVDESVISCLSSANELDRNAPGRALRIVCSYTYPSILQRNPRLSQPSRFASWRRRGTHGFAQCRLRPHRRRSRPATGAVHGRYPRHLRRLFCAALADIPPYRTSAPLGGPTKSIATSASRSPSHGPNHTSVPADNKNGRS